MSTWIAALMLTGQLAAADGLARTLPEPLALAIDERVELGDARVERGDHAGALAAYREALSLLPRPIAEWEACGWLMTAIGDTEFQAGDFGRARRTLSLALGCPGMQWNPFVHLRLGQAMLESGDCEGAADELVWVLANAGPELFSDEHPKYARFAETLLQRQPGEYC